MSKKSDKKLYAAIDQYEEIVLGEFDSLYIKDGVVKIKSARLQTDMHDLLKAKSKKRLSK